MAKNRKHRKNLSSDTASNRKNVSSRAADKTVQHARPPEPLSVSRLYLWLALAFIALFTLGIDISTMPHTVTMEDSGEFISSVHKFGIPHPPGYPLYVIFGHLLTLVPISTIAFRVHLFSALAGAGACIFVTLSALQLTRHLAPAVIAGLLYAVSRTFWAQSIIAEVYALNSLFFFALLWLALRLNENFTRKGFFVFALVYGLSLANHWPLIILASGAFAFLLWPWWRQVIRCLPLAFVCVLVGSSPYLMFWLLSKGEMEITFLGPIRSLGELWDYILRKEYAPDNVQPNWTWAHSFRFLLYFVQMLATEFWYLGLPLLVAGAMRAWKVLSRTVTLGLLAAFLSSPVLLLFAWRAEFHDLSQSVYSVFHLVPFGIAAIFISLAVAWGLDRFKLEGAKARAALVLAGLILVIPPAVANWRINNLREDTYGYDFAKLVFESLPPNAVFMAWADADIGSLVYTHVSAGVRPDILLTAQTGVILKEKIYDRRDSRTDSQRAAKLTSYIRDRINEGRRVFSSRRLHFVDDETFPFDYLSHGLYEELVPKPAGAPVTNPQLADAARPILDKFAAGEYGTQWMYHRNVLLRRLCKLLIQNGRQHALFTGNNECRMAYVEQLRDVEKRYKDADPIIEQVLATSDAMPIQDRLEIARVYFVNRIYMVNTGSGGGDRMANYQEAVDRVKPYLKDSSTCKNTLALSLLEARKQIPLDFDLDWMFANFSKCPKHRVFLEEIRKKLR